MRSPILFVLAVIVALFTVAEIDAAGIFGRRAASGGGGSCGPNGCSAGAPQQQSYAQYAPQQQYQYGTYGGTYGGCSGGGFEAPAAAGCSGSSIQYRTSTPVQAPVAAPAPVVDPIDAATAKLINQLKSVDQERVATQRLVEQMSTQRLLYVAAGRTD